MLDRFTSDFTARFPEVVGSRVLVALSGGADSVALLHLLLAARSRLGCVPAALHVHHHARGAEADRDAEFCASLCRDLEVGFELADIGGAPPPASSREAFWRQARYRRLEEARGRLACAAVATAHTVDDQAETVLLKLVRGSGPRGVAGIGVRRGHVIRPLLGFRRHELREWLQARSLAWCEDSSNAGTDLPRGFVRHRVLPLLRERWPSVADHLAAFAEILADDEALLAGLVAAAAPEPTPRQPVAAAVLEGLPRPLRQRWVLAVAARLPLTEPPSREQLASVDSMLSTGRPTAVDLGRHWVLRRRGAAVRLSPPPVGPFAPVAATLPSSITLPGGFVARLGEPPSRRAEHVARLAARLAGCRLRWRPPRPGERDPDGRVRLADRLARIGVPAEWRRAWPVLEADGTMIWVPGVEIAPGWDGDDATGVLAEVEEPWRPHARS